jgi:hypothetical protein
MSEPIYPKAELLEMITRAQKILKGRLQAREDFGNLRIISTNAEIIVALDDERFISLTKLAGDGTFRVRISGYESDWTAMDDLHLRCAFNLGRLREALRRLRAHMVLDDLADV